jgi:hypothetical protein
MTDDEGRADPKAHATPDTYGETLLYDYAKWMTTLALLALGGVLTITQTADLKDIKLFNIAVVLASITLAGILAFSTANGLVAARASGKEPPRGLPGLIKAATGFLGMGTGGFLMMWWDSLR